MVNDGYLQNRMMTNMTLCLHEIVQNLRLHRYIWHSQMLHLNTFDAVVDNR